MPALPSSRPFAAWLVRAVAVALVAGLAWQVPLVRFRRLDEVAAAEVFDAKAFAERFWAADLEPACGAANDVADVLYAVLREQRVEHLRRAHLRHGVAEDQEDAGVAGDVHGGWRVRWAAR